MKNFSNKDYAYPLKHAYIRVMEKKRSQPSRSADEADLVDQVTRLLSADPNSRITTDDGRDLAAVIMGRLGGLKGGRVRAEKLSADRRREIAIKAAQTRWKKASEANGED